MSVTVVMLRDAPAGSGGGVWRAGDTYSASDSYAAYLIGQGSAYAPGDEIKDADRTAVYQNPTTGALVGADGLVLSTASASKRTRILKRFSDAVGVTSANSGTAATASIDSSSPFGRSTYKIALDAGTTWTEVQLSGVGIANFDGHVIWKVWVEDYTKVTQITAYAGTSGYSRLYQNIHRLSNSDRNRWNGEHAIAVGVLSADTAATFIAGSDTLADTKLRIFGGGSATNVWIDVAVIPLAGRATHVITHDDCSASWMTSALPVLAANRLRATFAINSGDIGGAPSLYLSAEQVSSIASAGHAICGHNVTNTALADGSGSGTQTASQYTADYMAGAAAISGIVGAAFETDYHPWVQGRNNQAAHEAMTAAGLRIGRGTDIGYNFPQAGLGRGVLAMKCQQLHTLSQSQIAAICSAAQKYGATVIWMVHEVTTAGGVGVETSVANYAYLCSLVSGAISAAQAVHRTAPELCRELYAEKAVANSLL